ncbi:MAG TPA: hypothetical protein VGI21_02510, partial [Streptosporangiaceae bacterium]
HFVAFIDDLGGDTAVDSSTVGGDGVHEAMRRVTLRRLLILVYIIIGLIVAWEHHYITVAFLKTLLSAILAILLWWLVLLGVSLHIH